MTLTFDDIDFMAAVEGKPEPVQYEGPREFLFPPPAPPARNVLDLIAAKQRLDIYTIHIRDMAKTAKAFSITDDDHLKAAVEMATQAKALNNNIEKARKEIVDEPNAFIKGVNAFAKTFTADLQAIEADLKGKISRYQVAQEQKRLEAQRMAAEEARRLQESLNKQAEEAGIDPIALPAPIVPDVPKTTRTEAGSASLRKVWRWKLADISKVPAEYLTTKDTAISNAVKMGLREIPGIEIYEEAVTVLRTAGTTEPERF